MEYVLIFLAGNNVTSGRKWRRGGHICLGQYIKVIDGGGSQLETLTVAKQREDVVVLIKLYALQIFRFCGGVGGASALAQEFLFSGAARRRRKSNMAADEWCHFLLPDFADSVSVSSTGENVNGLPSTHHVFTFLLLLCTFFPALLMLFIVSM